MHLAVVLPPRLSLEQWPEPVADDRINTESRSAVLRPAKQQLAASIAVSVHGIDELIFWENVQVEVVRGLSKDAIRSERHGDSQTQANRLSMPAAEPVYKACQHDSPLA